MAQNDSQSSNDNDIDRMVERKMSPNLADRGEVIDHLIAILIDNFHPTNKYRLSGIKVPIEDLTSATGRRRLLDHPTSLGATHHDRSTSGSISAAVSLSSSSSSPSSF